MNKMHLSWDDYDKDIQKLIKKLKKRKFDPKTTAVIAIARGGLMPAQMVAYALGLREVYTVVSKVYDGEEQRQEQEITNVLTVDFEGYDNFIVVDDIYDSGKTMKGILFALEQMSVVFSENCSFIPAVVHSQKSKKELKEAGIIVGRRLKGSPWVVYPYDHLSKEFE